MESTAFTRTMARVPGPVTVVTTVDGLGRRWGFTANSFSSVSLDPPLILVCLDRRASTHTAFTSARRFMVNVLTDDQAGIARRFARSGTERFGADDMAPCEFGLPGLPSAAARIACSMYRIVRAGDHSILIGQVEASHVGDGTPLVYVDRSFARPASADLVPSAR